MKTLFIDLYFKPKIFFKNNLSLYRKYYIWFVYIVGICYFFERFDMVCARAELQGGSKIEFLSSISWAAYYVLSLVFGVLNGALIWLVGGWWYKIRLKWSDVIQPNPFESRLVYIFSSFVYAAPAIIISLVTSFVFENPWKAYESINIYSMVIVFVSEILYFWSLIISYKGITILFNPVKWKAKLWFVILPTAIRVIGIIIIAMGFYRLYR